MKKISRDSLPHVIENLYGRGTRYLYSFCAYLSARWWGVELDGSCLFSGRPRFRRQPGSRIIIGRGCRFNSSGTSNLIGVNRPCIISTLKKGAIIEIGPLCGFSGTVIGCASRIVLSENVRCGANTLITDTDWHMNDPRSSPDAPIIIERDVWLGVNVCVLKGVTIGAKTLVGAGSIVTRSLPPGVIAAGIPAVVIKEI